MADANSSESDRLGVTKTTESDLASVSRLGRSAGLWQAVSAAQARAMLILSKVPISHSFRWERRGNATIPSGNATMEIASHPRYGALHDSSMSKG
ncbi:MAG TPA: hypothetical protein VFM14_13040 [Gemmatimonadales bacterium]|nr:hypothetical protein [Gemmatimonadales bacterium]